MEKKKGEGNTVKILSNFLLDVYRCSESEVISLLGSCDGVTDCFDHSDEENCTGITGTIDVYNGEKIDRQIHIKSCNCRCLIKIDQTVH